MKRLALLIPVVLAACTKDTKPPDERPRVTVKGKAWDVDLVATRRARKEFRCEAPALVAFPHPRFHHYQPGSSRAVDVAFIDDFGNVVEVETLDPNREEGITSKVETRYAFFLPAGTGVAKGDSAEINDVIRKTAAEDLTTIKIGGLAVTVRLALTPDERTHGLMFVKGMSKDEGMLFVYDEPDFHSFWMRNTLIPLDIAHFAEDGALLNVCEMEIYPHPATDREPHAPSDGKAQYVLELNRGWFRNHGLIDATGKPLKPVQITLPPEGLK